jgi:radical SAM superfamily enzyme YgiQ (UPF0313 family)
MSDPRAVVVVTPRFTSFERFGVGSMESKFQVLTRDGAPASNPNLELLFNSPLAAPPMGRGLKHARPMAGYFLESFLKVRGYQAKTVFDWEDDAALTSAMELDPIAVLFSTTFVTDPGLLADCLGALRNVAGSLPIVVGGPYILKQARILGRTDRGQRRSTLAAFDVDDDADLLFSTRADRRLHDAIYVASEHGEHTLLEVLVRLAGGARGAADLAEVPNLVLRSADGGWQPTERRAEPFDLDGDATRWELIDEMPAVVPIRSSVGCPNRCRYCDFHALHPRTVLRSPESIAAEISAAAARNRRFVNFVDDNVFLSTERARTLARRIIEDELDVVWGGFFRADRVDRSNISQIRESGCRFGICGVESGDPGQLERMGRDSDLGATKSGIELATAAGIETAITIILGYPGETRESIDNTARFIDSLPSSNTGPLSYEAYPFYLLPGSAIDAPAARRRFDLRGRHARWRHRTMSARDVDLKWAPYLFRAVRQVPYNYQTSDAPAWWSARRRREAWDKRRELTLAFLDQEPDDEIQQRFAELFSVTVEGGAETRVPRWQDLLAPRERQPGGTLVPKARG